MDIALGIFVCALQLADAWTTYQGVKAGAREEWPPMRALISLFERCVLSNLKATYAALVAAKGTGIALTWWLATSADPYRVPVLAAIALGYFFLVDKNCDELQKQRARR
jgi:hypothetical protein